METGVPARLSKADGRRFGLGVGGAFLAIAAFVWWRGRMGAVPYLAGLGGGLVLAGLLVPTLLGPLYRGWMGLALLLSKVTTPIFMGLVYFIVIMPIGLFMRLIGRRSLVRVPDGDGFWIDRKTGGDASRMKRQF